MSRDQLSKIDVIMRIINRIRQGTRVTAAALAEEHGVTERTIFRYLETVQSAGYPIFFDRKRRSYRFTDGFDPLSLPGRNSLATAALDFNNHLMSSLSVGIAAYRVSGECILANETLARLIGATRDQTLEQNFRHLASWQTSGLLEMAEEVIRTGEERTLDLHFRTTFGKEVWVSATVTLFHNDGENYIFLMFTDITGRKQNDIVISGFRSAIHHGPNLTVITDNQGTIEYTSAKLFEMTGYTPEEAIGRNASLFKSGKTLRKVYDDLWQTIMLGREWSGELCNRRKDGSLYWESVRISPIFTADGTISHFISAKEDITTHKELQEELYRYATTDCLTGIPNRRMITDLGNREIGTARRRRRSLSIMLVDIDGFRGINETLGHSAGDEVLRWVAATCEAEVRVSDIAGRLGGDDFLVILPETVMEEARAVAERISTSIVSTTIVWEGEMIPCSGIAIAEMADSDNLIGDLLARAEAALAGVKNTGRSQIVVAT